MYLFFVKSLRELFPRKTSRAKFTLSVPSGSRNPANLNAWSSLYLQNQT